MIIIDLFHKNFKKKLRKIYSKLSHRLQFNLKKKETRATQFRLKDLKLNDSSVKVALLDKSQDKLIKLGVSKNSF